jgi:sulfonate transport system permease protein
MSAFTHSDAIARDFGARTKMLIRKPAAADRDPARARHRRQVSDKALAVAVPTSLVLFWQLASSKGWIDSRLYPSPTDVAGSFRELYDNGQLWDATYTSARRMVLGYLIGAAIAIVAGVLMGLSRRVRAAFEPMFWALYTVPKLALLPVFLTVFGFQEQPILALIASTVFFFVWISTMTAVMSVPIGYREAAMVSGAGRWHVFRHVILPGALPQIFVGLRVAAGVSVLTLVGVEFVFGSKGLGYLINNSRTIFAQEQAYAGIVVVSILGLAFSMLVRLLGRIACPWVKEDQAVGAL